MQIDFWQIILAIIVLLLVYYAGYQFWVGDSGDKKSQSLMAIIFGSIFVIKAITEFIDIKNPNKLDITNILIKFIPGFLLVLVGVYYFLKKVKI